MLAHFNQEAGFSVGDVVVVKSGGLDPDLGIEIGGWQGQVVEVSEEDDGQAVTIAWDESTIRQMDPVILKYCQLEDFDHAKMTLQASELRLMFARGPVLISNVATMEEIDAKVTELRTRRREKLARNESPQVQQAVLPPVAPTGLRDLFRRAHSLAPLLARYRYGIELLGRNLLARRYVTLYSINEHYASFGVKGLDNRQYLVTISNENGTLDGVTFTCTCRTIRQNAATRCEHMAAAAYALQQDLPAPTAIPAQPAPFITASPVVMEAQRWEERLSLVLSGKRTVKEPKSRSILLFSLRERTGVNGWKLSSYTLPISIVEDAVLHDRAALQKAIIRLGKHYQLKEISSYTQTPANLLYGSPELNNLARILGQTSYYQSGNPLAFALPYLHNALLFRGDSDYYGNPFFMPITQVDPTPRSLQLVLTHEETGTRLLPSLSDDEGEIRLEYQTTGIVNYDPLWVLTGTRLLRVEGDGDLLKNLLETRDILIPQTAKNTFVTRYLPKLLDRANVSGDGIGKREELETNPVHRVYLSEADATIVADLVFAYDTYEVPLDLAWPETATQYDEERDVLFTIHRRVEEEEAAWRAMSEFGMKRDGNRFMLRRNVTPIDFLLRSVPQLQAAGYEVYGEEALKSARVNRNQPTMRMVVSSGIDWFDVQAVVSYGDLDVAFSAIRKAIKQRQGYVKLPDGSLGVLPPELIARYRHLFALGEVTEQGVRLSKTQATLLEFALQDVGAQVDEEYTRRLELLRNFTLIEARTLSTAFRGELRHYQQAGFDWLHFLHDYGFGGCLADDMGLGKTVQALVFLQSLYASGHTSAATLIVMPRSLLENWAREAARFTPDLQVLIHADSDRCNEPAPFANYQLVLTTYGVMLRDLELFNQYRFHYLVLDEAQAIKNSASQSARAARLLHGDHRLALTGTPVENSTEELWSLFNFLNPGQLGSAETFREQFAIPIQRHEDEAAAKALRALVHPFILRRTKEQVTPELPPRTERLIFCEMSAMQKKIYQRTRDQYRAELLGLIDGGGMQEARFKVLEGLLRLRQLANDPRLLDNSFKGVSSKFESILEAMEVLREEGHKALVFSQFTSMLALLRTSLDGRNWPYLYLDGKTKHRQELVDRFQADETIPFFLISLKAGGLGLNLTAADYVIHIDPWWNPAVERQATDRTHRIGQERPVMVYKFIAEDTVEEKILLLQEKKQALVDQLISADGSVMKSLTRDDVAALFT